MNLLDQLIMFVDEYKETKCPENILAMIKAFTPICDIYRDCCRCPCDVNKRRLRSIFTPMSEDQLNQIIKHLDNFTFN